MVAAVSLPVVAERKRSADWRWQLRNAVTSVDALDRALTLSRDEREGACRAERVGLPVSITPYYLSLVDRNDPDDPTIRRRGDAMPAFAAVGCPPRSLVAHVTVSVITADEMASKSASPLYFTLIL